MTQMQVRERNPVDSEVGDPSSRNAGPDMA